MYKRIGDKNYAHRLIFHIITFELGMIKIHK